jgi:multiple sugar transport system substrate-binding protein
MAFPHLGSLVEKAGYKIADIPNTWDAFLDFFKPVQDSLRKQGMRTFTPMAIS